MENLQKNLRRILKEKKVKQKELAKRMGCTPAYISKILNGKNNPTIPFLARICAELDISLADLFKEE